MRKSNDLSSLSFSLFLSFRFSRLKMKKIRVLIHEEKKQIYQASRAISAFQSHKNKIEGQIVILVLYIYDRKPRASYICNPIEYI